MATPTAAERSQGFSSTRVIAKPHRGTGESDLGGLEETAGVRLRRRSAGPGEYRVLETMARTPIAETVSRLRATGRYEYVELDYVVRADATPDDPRFLAGEQWALRNIGQSNGTAGADIKAEDGWGIRSNASEIVVAIVDSGIRRTHEDLFANLWVNPSESGANAANGRDDDANGYVDDVNGINSTIPANVTGNGAPVDAAGHGTAVASVIGAVGNNGTGMSGVAWNVRLMALRFLDADGYGFISDEVECIDYAIAKRAQIINASFGGANYTQSLFDALKRARDAGIIVVCAAGNDSSDSNLNPHYPSNYLLDNIIAVANTTRTDALSTSSAFGAGLIELGAPGTSILLASAAGDREYQVSSGTSFSAPMVSGVLALVKAKFPNESYRETINRVLRAVDEKPALTGKTATGGRLNLAAALQTTNGRPFNDEFAKRSRLAGETVIVRSAAQLATREAREPVHAGVAGNGSLWWSWTAPRSGSTTIDTTGSAIDTLLAVYTGSTIDALTSVAVNDDESGTLTSSKVTFTAKAGTIYQIAVDAKTATNGLVVLHLNLIAGNDEFASAQVVSGRSWSVKADNRVATRETGEPRIRNNTGGHSVWYRWVAPATRRYHLATFSSEFNTMLGVYTGNTISSLAEVAAVATAGDSNFTMQSAGTTIFATAGTAYNIAVDSEVSATGTSATGNFTLSCIDAEWEFFGDGPMVTPAVAADGTLYTADDYGYLYALNPDGSRKWAYLMSGYGTNSAPTIATDGTIYVGDDLNYVHAVSPAGTRKWRALLRGIIQSSAAVAADGTVYIRSDDNILHALAAENGIEKWSYRMGTPKAPTFTSPVVGSDGTIYCAGGDSRLYAITPNGTQKWSFGTDFIFASPALGADGTIYFGVLAPTRRFYALRSDGTLKWEFIAGDSVSSSAAIGTDGTLYFGCNDRKLYAVAADGQLRWTFETGDAIRGTSPLIASDGSIYTGSSDGKVYCVESGGTLRRTYSTANEIRSSPILHNGRLYLSSSDYRLYSVEVGQVPGSTVWPMHRQNANRTARVVWSPLRIAVQPQAQSAEVGDAISFSVGAVGTAPVAYQWSFNGQPIAGATGTIQKVDPVIHATGGQYSVRVTDPTGSVLSNAVALTVTTPLIPPSFFTPPAPQTVVAGTNLTITAAATGSTPMTYQWLRDGAPISGATNASLVLSAARPVSSGNYSVRVTNFAGTLTSTAALVTINPVSRIANLSIRSRVGGTAGDLTVGITVGGAQTGGEKPMLIRAVGPTLAAFGVDGALDDPRLALLSGEKIVSQNDNWDGNAQVSSTSVQVGAFGLATATSKDAAVVHSAASGGYTVSITGASSNGGVALAEVYDATPADNFVASTPRLINVSALTQVGSGGDILIAGFSVAGNTPKTVLVRGIGPALAGFGVGGTLGDPKLELFRNGTDEAIATNDNWGSAANAAQIATAAGNVGAFALAADGKDAVLLVTLQPGSYTAQVSGGNGSTGLALVEVYEVP